MRTWRGRFPKSSSFASARAMTSAKSLAILAANRWMHPRSDARERRARREGNEKTLRSRDAGRSASTTTTNASTGKLFAKPSIHVLTSYAVHGVETSLPALRVVPLALTDDEGKPCVRALWSAVRLMREASSSRTSERPFEANDGRGIELFAQAGLRDEGEVLRYGIARTSARELAVKALGRGSTREVTEGAAFELSPASHDSKHRVAYGEILREALYENALSTMGDLFDVSRVGRSGVMLTARLEPRSWAWTAVSDAVAILDQYTLDVEVSDEKSARIWCTLGHELRSPLTVRQILDDPSLMELPEGSEVVALGGPHLQGQLSYANIGGKSIGEPRDELKGESLLSYHRNRYPARIALLERAREADDAVQLVQPGRPPTAYPAELLSPVIKMHMLDANMREAVSDTCAGSPMELQRRLTRIRSMIGQPFEPLLRLEEKMQRLADPPLSFHALEDVRRGDLDTGPAFMPPTVAAQLSRPLCLLLGESRRGEDVASKYVDRLGADVASALRGWGASEDVVRALKSDIEATEICWYDDGSLSATRVDFVRAFRASMSSTFLIPLAPERPFVEAGARQASSRISNTSTVRWAADETDAKRLCFALIARRGGQATVCRDPIVPNGAYVVGAGTRAGLPVVDAYGRVISRQVGAPAGAEITSAVRFAIDSRIDKIVIHHAGESNNEDIRAAVDLARDNGVTILSLVDVLEHDFGRVLGWSREAGTVTQPDRGFWSILGDNDVVVVTTAMESNALVRGVSRPLRLRARLGELVARDIVNQVLSLCSVDVNYYAKNQKTFRLPITLRSSMNDGDADVLLVRRVG